MKRILIFLPAILLAGPLFAQSGDDLFRRADSLYAAGIELYNNEEYLAAAALFEQCDSLNKAAEREEPYYSDNAKHWEGNSYYKAGDTVRTMRADSLFYMLTPVDQRLTVKSDSLAFIGNKYSQDGDFREAMKYLQMCGELEEKVLGVNHYSYGNTLIDIGVCFSNIKEYKTSVDYYVRALHIFESDNDKNPNINTALVNIGYSYLNIGDYEKAAEYFTRALEFTRENYGDRHEDYIYPLSYLALCHNWMGNYDKSIEYGERTLELANEVYGAGTHYYAWVYETVADDYKKLEDYEKAIEYRTRFADLKREGLGEKSPEYASTLADLANDYSRLGNLEKAIEYETMAADIYKEVNDEGSWDYINTQAYLSLYYEALKDYEKAIESAGRALDLYKDNYGENDAYYASLLSATSRYYSELGNYDKAIELETEALEIRKEVLGDRHPDYAFSLDILANCYSYLGNYEQAIELGTQAMEIRREVLGDRHPDYATSLSIVAGYFFDLGNYEKALELETEAMVIRKEALGEHHPYYAYSLDRVAWDYMQLGNYEKAIESGLEAMGIIKEVFGERNHDYARTLNRLSWYYFKLGNYDKAIGLGTEAMEIVAEDLGDRSLLYSSILNNLTCYYNDLGNYEKAIELGTEAVDIKRELGVRNDSYALSLNNLAVSYATSGNYEKAIELGAEALEIQKETIGAQHPDYALSLSNMAKYYGILGNYEKALELGTEAMEIRRDVLGDKHPSYAWSLNSVGGFYFKSGDYERALEDKRLSENVYAENLRNNFSFLTAAGRTLYWDDIKGEIEDGTQLCVSYPSDGSNELAYDVELLSKGILLSSEREFDKVIKESGDEELLAKFEQLRQDRLQLEVYYKQAIADRPAEEVARLESEADQLEKDLIAGSKEYGDFTRSLAIEWADVRDALRDKDLAIEFAKVTVDSTDYYVALILRKGWDAPKCVNLGTAEDFEPYLAMSNNELYRSQEFSEKVWSGIVEAADLQEGDNVYFSPDGIFYQLGIEYLPVVSVGDGSQDGDGGRIEDGVQSDGGFIMADKYNMRRLSSTKELCFEPSATAENSAVLYGGLVYEAKSEAEQGSEDKFASAVGASADDSMSEKDASTVELAMAGETRRDLTVGRLLAERGAEVDSLTRSSIKYLPGTLAETDTLATMLMEKKIDYTEYTGSDGTEESFKALTGNAPKLIHIATHGFYLSPTSAELMSQQRHNDFLTLGEDQQNNVIDYSMSRSGLLFAGAQSAWFGEPVPAGEDDGILTAQEIAGLDLRGVDMAVLSACSTANGEVTGDGVAGLQRGFKKAGVKTLLLTLWEVNDRATQLFMTKFYENLTNGKSKRQAFEAAQSYLRTYEDWTEYEIDDPDAEPVYDDTIGDWVRPTKTVRELGRPYAAPQYWAAFIMLD